MHRRSGHAPKIQTGFHTATARRETEFLDDGVRIHRCHGLQNAQEVRERIQHHLATPPGRRQPHLHLVDRSEVVAGEQLPQSRQDHGPLAALLDQQAAVAKPLHQGRDLPELVQLHQRLLAQHWNVGGQRRLEPGQVGRHRRADDPSIQVLVRQLCHVCTGQDCVAQLLTQPGGSGLGTLQVLAHHRHNLGAGALGVGGVVGPQALAAPATSDQPDPECR